MTIFGELFPEKNRGKQLIPSCFAALAIARLFGILCFNNESVDSILSYGDRLYTHVKRKRKEQILRDNPRNFSKDEIDWLLDNEDVDIDDIPKKLCISNFLATIEVELEVVVGDINAQNFEEILDVKRGLEKFFETNNYGILQSKGDNLH